MKSIGLFFAALVFGVLAGDERNPGAFGFDEWLSVTNFFDIDPVMGRKGAVEEFKGDSSEIIVGEALKFIAARAPEKPTFTVTWYGSPHAPFRASENDRADFAARDASAQNHYGELVAMDRSLGTLRAGLRKLGIADNTLVVFCSDNGGLPNLEPGTVGGLRGFKNSVFEGGLRVPAIMEWPAAIKRPRITRYPACTMDLFPTIAEIVGLPADARLLPVDGLSLLPVFESEPKERAKPIAFRHLGRAALVDGRYKILTQKIAEGAFELYDLEADPKETTDIAAEKSEIAARLRSALLQWNASVDASVTGKDYRTGKVSPDQPATARLWRNDPLYQPYLEEWKKHHPELMTPAGANP